MPKVKINCYVCKKILLRKPSEIKRTKYGFSCCKGCLSEFSKQMGFGKQNKGRKASPETIKKLKEIRKHRVGKLAPAWKGEKAGYFAIHHWMRKILGNPKKCEHCGKIGKKEGRKWNLDWANISREYKRDKKDYIGLCRKCHAKFDGIGFKREVREKKGLTISKNKSWKYD